MITGSLLLLCGLLLCGLALYAFLCKRGFGREGVLAQGVVRKIQVKESADKNGKVKRAFVGTYEYATPEGRSFLGKADVACDATVGQALTVRYLPSAPHRSRMHVEGRMGWGPLILGVCGASIVLGGVLTVLGETMPQRGKIKGRVAVWIKRATKAGERGE